MIPPAYRRLLRAHPQRWREQHEQVVLTMLLEADEARGRSRPSPTTCAALVVHGLVERLRRPVTVGPPLALLVDRPIRFDQTNGMVPDGTDDLDRRGLRIDRQHGRGGLDAAGTAPDGLMTPIGM